VNGFSRLKNVDAGSEASNEIIDTTGDFKLPVSRSHQYAQDLIAFRFLIWIDPTGTVRRECSRERPKTSRDIM